MDVVNNQLCYKHNLPVHLMCTRLDCFKDKNILICKNCLSDHHAHPSELIETQVLNQKVVNLMKKRVEYEEVYDRACDRMISELKMFRFFKEDVVSRLNAKERTLNDLCKKIKRYIPYEKDENLFKKHFGYIYLSTRAVNQNLDLYKNFRKQLLEQIAELRRSVSRLEVGIMEQDVLLLKKDHQICEIVKRMPDYTGIEEVVYSEPRVKKFKREIVKSKCKEEYGQKLFRINDDEFLTYNNKHDMVRWYHQKNPLHPRLVPLGSPINNMVMLGKNAFCSLENGGIRIFDFINEKIVKEYASSNQKSAKICELLALNTSTVASFITNPNQIISFRFREDREALETVKAVLANHKALKTLRINEQKFVLSTDDFTVSLMDSESFDVESTFKLSGPVSGIAKYCPSTLMVGGDFNTINMLDLRTRKTVNKLSIGGFCHELQKTSDNCMVYSCHRSLHMFDWRMLKEIYESAEEDGEIRQIRALNPSTFLTSSNALNIWRMIV